MRSIRELGRLTPDRFILAVLLLLLLTHLWPAYQAAAIRRKSMAAYESAQPLLDAAQAAYRAGVIAPGDASDPRLGAVTLRVAGQPRGRDTLLLVPMIKSSDGFRPLAANAAQPAGATDSVVWFCISSASQLESTYLMSKTGSLPGRYAPPECRRQRMEEKIGGVSWLKK